MLFKLSGSLIVIAISFAYGLFCSKKDKFHLEDLREFKKFFLILTSEITYSNTPLYQIFLDIAEKTGDITSLMCKNAAYEIINNQTSAELIFKKAFLDIFNFTYLDSEDKKYFLSFSKILKSDDKNQIISNIKTIISYIENKEQEVINKSLNNMKMYKSLGVLGGLLIAVILI